MLFTPVRVSAVLELPPGRLDLPTLMDVCESALRRYEATPQRGTSTITFDVTANPKNFPRLSDPDLVMVSGGELEVSAEPNGYRLTLHVRPRGWMLAFCIGLWTLLVWASGVVATPWRYLFALGGLPMLGLAWVPVWTNMRALLDKVIAEAKTAVTP